MAELNNAFSGIFGISQLCFKSEQLLSETCATLKGAATELDERALCVKSHWKRTSIQLKFINQIWESLDKEHQDIQHQILQDKLIKKSSDDRSNEVNRVKYVLVKRGLDDVIEDLELWQKMFDPSWFLILKVSNPFIDQQMSKHSSNSSVFDLSSIRDVLKPEPVRKISVFLPNDGLERNTEREIPYTSAKYVKRTRLDKWVIVDPMVSDAETNLKLTTKDVRDLATRLSCADASTFSILQCRGVVRQSTSDDTRPFRFDFVFQTPRGTTSEPSSLRACLVSQLNHTLSERFKLAKQIATAVSYVHTFGFVHKNIRPETLLTFEGPKTVIESCFLIGFEKFRNVDGRTMKVGDSAWEHNLYRHPQRQGMQPEEIYSMQHDIYSLGVCLLEIGLWGSFVSYDDVNTPIPGTTLRVTFNEAEFSRPAMMKDHLVALAKRELPRKMGERYEEVVVNCLTCLDRDNADFGD